MVRKLPRGLFLGLWIIPSWNERISQIGKDSQHSGVSNANRQE